MSQRSNDGWAVAFGVLALVGFSLIGTALFIGLAAHPYVAAAWALAASAAATWFGVLHLDHRRAESLRALGEERRRAVLDRAEPRTVADVIVSCRSGRRIGDAERDVVMDALRVHFAAGRLESAELDERLGQTLAARTIDDLIRVVRDLPSEVTGQ